MFSRRQKLKYLVLFLVIIGLCNILTVQLTSHTAKTGKRNTKGEASLDDGQHGTIRSILEGSLGSKSEHQDTGQGNEPDVRNATRTKSALSKTNLTYFRDVSCNAKASVVTLVPTLPQNTELRRAIRETWGNVSQVKDTTVQVVFVTGKQSKNDKTIENERLMNETKTYGDILLGEFVYDISIKTTLPLLRGISWILDHCRSLQYVLIVNEDTVVVTKRLLDRLDYCEKNGVSDSRTWMGKIVTNSKVQRLESGMFYVSKEQYSEEYFPPFCTDENGYVITRTVAKEFLESARNRSSLVPIADVFLSIISKERNWTLVNDNMFTRSALQGNNVCAGKSAVTMHAPKNPSELITAWKNMNNKTLLKECMDPDLDLVLPPNVDNRPYLEKVLAYKFSNPHVCFDKAGKPLDIFMIVLISTPPDHGEVRKAIRETWCKEQVVLGETIRCVFIMGERTSETDELRSQLRQEDIRYGDLIRASFHESFQNLTLKVILGLKWISENCQHTKYFYKGDEDMFVNFNNIISYLKNLRSRGEALTKFFVGSRLYSSIRYSPSIPEHKSLRRYHVPDNMYFGHFYPPYCSGGGYILSAETVPDLYREALRTSLINVDDAFQGILTKRLGYGPIGHSGFKSWGGKTDTCSLRERNTMTVHGIGKNAKNLYDVWNRYHNATANCTGFSI